MVRHCAAATLALFSGLAFGQGTVSDFDGVGDTNITLQQFNSDPGPSIEAAGGNPGGFLQIAPSAFSQMNFATFDQTEIGAPSASTFRFDFRFDQLVIGGADGISFDYYNTALFPANGNIGVVFPFFPEDPAAAGVLGFGFDTWNNGTIFDTVPATGFDYSEISVFYNGSLISRVDDTRALPVPLNLKDGVFHTVTGEVDFVGGTVTLSVDGNAIFTNLAVPGLAPFEHRNGFAGFTGGASQRSSIDNVSVLVPEPAAISLLALGGLAGVAGRRRHSCRP